MRHLRKKILFMAEGITMAHFVRSAALAETLDPDEWDIYFWTPKRYHALLRQKFSRLEDLRTIDPNKFLDALARGQRIHSEKTIQDYVRDDEAIFDEIHPDLVIGDYRLSLCVSAPHYGVPYASIFNAQWNPYWAQPAIVPELSVTQWVSPRLMNYIFAALRPAIYSWHARPFNTARRAYGLPPLPYDLRGICTAGDLVFYPDVPDFVPLQHVPSHHHFIGICSWSLPAPKPAWWTDVMASSRPKIFVALGSSGSVKALPAVLEAASSLPVEVILATSGRAVGPIPTRVHAAELLPYEETARQSAVVVSHGGTGGMYMTLATGTPMLAIPNNIDNHLSTALLEKHGAGIGIRVELASVDRLRSALQRMLAESTFREAAQQWAGMTAVYDTKKIFPALLRSWFAGRA